VVVAARRPLPVHASSARSSRFGCVPTASAGNRSGMADHDELPTTDKPLHGKPRGRVAPLLAVIGLIVVVAVVFLVLTLVQQNT
jgi:hypothetical protein